tara:strand:+ start:451 stop:921 length:471 start_codon:yes stop_codon:yes gene_type:complete
MSKKSTEKKPKVFSTRLQIMTIAIAIAIVVGYLSITSFDEATTRYFSVNDILSKQNNDNQETFGIIAKLVPETFHRSSDGLTAYFQVRDDNSGSNLNVSYQGEVGQIFFNENAEIIMRGKILNDGIFYTKDLSVKCPSKYLDEMYTEDYSKENSSS